MTPVVDVISNVIDAMKPTISVDAALVNPTYGINVLGMTEQTLNKMYVGQKIKCSYSGGSIIHYGTVYSIGADSFIIQLSEIPKVPPEGIEIVLRYHYGHPLEIINHYAEMAENKSYKEEMFPAIWLIMDFEERQYQDGYRTTADLRFILLTDTDREYDTSERYTYSFKAILQPLYLIFLETMAESQDFECETDWRILPKHTKTDRPSWGRNAPYRNEALIANQFIDAMELTDFTIKIYKVC